MRSTIGRRHILVLVTTGVMAACSTPSPDPSAAAPTVTPTFDTEAVVSNESSSTVVAGDDGSFESYDDLIAAAAGQDSGAMAQLALAEVSADLGPIDGAPVVDPTLVDVRNGSDAISRLQSFGDSLSATQRDAIERWWAELTSDDALVYRSADDPEYLQAYRDAIDDGLPVEINRGAVEADVVDAPPTARPGDMEPQGMRAFATSHQRGLVGQALPVAQQIDQDVTNDTAQQALEYFTRRLGGAEVNMEVYFVEDGDARVRADEYANATATIDGTFFSPDPGDPWDFDKSLRECIVHVKDVPSFADDQAKYRSIVAHEVFHCWQRINAFSYSGNGNVPKFYSEGTAMWAGEQFSREGSGYGRERMTLFFDRSTYHTGPSSARGYDGIGFWTQMAQLRGGVDGLWRKLPAINAVAEGGEEVTFTVAVSGVDDERVAQLASSAAGQPTWGAGWDLTGLSVGEDQRSIHERRMGARHEVFERQQQIVSYSLNEADLAGDGPWWIIDVNTVGLINAHWDNDDTFIATTPGTRQFCTDGACVCPDGTTPASGAEPVPGESDSIQIALTGTATNGASVTITSATADEVCPPRAVASVLLVTPSQLDPGHVRVQVLVESGVLRTGDRLETLIGTHETATTILRIETLAIDPVDSVGAGEQAYVGLILSGDLEDFFSIQRLVRATD